MQRSSKKYRNNFIFVTNIIKMSQEIIIETDNPSYAEMIINLAKKLRLKLVVNPKPESASSVIDSQLQKIINEGGDMSYIDNPVEWQKELRKDRNII